MPAPAFGARPGVAERAGDEPRGVAEAEVRDERGVELADRDGAAGDDDRVAVGDRLLGRERERLERAGERALRQRLLRLERRRPSRRGGPPRRRSRSAAAPRSARPRGAVGTSASDEAKRTRRRRSIGSRPRLSRHRPRRTHVSKRSTWRRARSAAAAVRLRGLDRPLRRLRARPRDASGATAGSTASSAAARCGSRRRRAASTSRRTTSRSSEQVEHFLGLPFDLDGLRRLGGRRAGRSRVSSRRSPASGRRSRSTRSRRSSPRSRRSRSRSSRRPRSGAASSSATGSRTSTRTRSRPASASRRRPRTSCSRVGFSNRKAEYVIGLARSDLDLDELASLPDEEVTARLVALRGLGEWTADWFLARHLARPHAWPAGDLGLRKAVAAFYGDVPDLRAFAPALPPVREPERPLSPDRTPTLPARMTVRHATADDLDALRALWEHWQAESPEPPSVGGRRAGRRTGPSSSARSTRTRSSSPRRTASRSASSPPGSRITSRGSATST